jgi:serpin B
MTKTIGLGALVAAIVATAACGSKSDGNDPVGGSGGSGGTGGSAPTECYDAKPGCVLPSSKQRDLKPVVAEADRTAFGKSNAAFALDMEHQLKGMPNTVFSPFSISTALAMTYAGARSTTEKAIAKALHFDLPQEKLHPAFDELLLTLDARAKQSDSFKGGGFRLHVANALWSQVGLGLAQSFSDLLYVNYGAPVRLADFAAAPKESETLINGWVSKQTEGLIPSLLKDNVTPETQLVLVNALYFDAAWAYPFSKEQTKTEPFKPTTATSAMVPMMHRTVDTTYASSADWEAVEIPYAGVPTSMVVVMPKIGTVDAFQSSLDAPGLAAIVAGMTHKAVDLTLPQFKFGTRVSLKKPLSDLGMAEAFGPSADLSGITGMPNGFLIQDVIHEAVIDVDEAGTKAAAATAVVVATAGAGVDPEPAKIVVDHPFLFFITDRPTGAILFAGRVDDPSKH